MLYFHLMKNVFCVLFAMAATFLISEYILVPANLYYELWWLDIPMHIWGGFLIGSLSLNLLKIQNKTSLISLAHVLAYVFFVACIWEVAEYFKGVVDYTQIFGWFDTVKDMFDGLLGGYIAFKLWKK